MQQLADSISVMRLRLTIPIANLEDIKRISETLGNEQELYKQNATLTKLCLVQLNIYTHQ